MTWEKAKELWDKIQGLDQEKAIEVILEWAKEIEGSDPEPSPLTPSGAVPVYLKPNQEKKRKKKPGRKKGHPGKSRKVPDHIDKQAEHRLETCPHCQNPLKKTGKTRKRYIEDLPQVQPIVTEHIIHSYWCSCCKKYVEPAVTEAMPNDNIGLHTFVVTAWQHYLGGISINYIDDQLKKLSRFKISPGALNQGWIRLARLLTPEYERIGREARNSAVLHIDETGWRQNGGPRWLWCFTNKLFCYYVIDKSRGSIVIKRVLGEIFRGTLISDFWSAYDKFEAWAKQKCLFHLFTELEKVDKRNTSVQWDYFRQTLYSLLEQAVKLWKDKSAIPAEKFQRKLNGIEKHLDSLIRDQYDDADCLRLCKRLHKHRGALFTFLNKDDVNPYNNHAEQQMRKPVLWRRRCQQNRSDRGADAQAVLMSIFRTAELQGLNPVDYVETLAKQKIIENHINSKNKTKIKSGKKAA